jgi:hypothetical protein
MGQNQAKPSDSDPFLDSVTRLPLPGQVLAGTNKEFVEMG